MTNTCTCGTPTRDNAYVCDNCLTDLSRALGDITWLTEQLEITLSKQKAATSGNTPSSDKALPLHVGALEARTLLRTTLVTWVRFCTEEQIRNSSPRNGWPDDDLPAIARWLMWRVDGLAFSDMGTDAVTDITRAVAKAHRVVDRPAEQKYAGPCECGRDLYHKPGALEAKCRECERVYVVAELHEWMQSEMHGKLFTAREGATLLCKFGVETKQQTIDKWQERGRVEVKGHNAAGKRLYLFDDLMTLAAQSLPKSA